MLGDPVSKFVGFFFGGCTFFFYFFFTFCS